MADPKTVKIHVDNNSVFDVGTDEIPDETKTVGEVADLVAYANNVAGKEFSFKVDGAVAERADDVRFPDAAFLELVEVTDVTEVPAPVAAANVAEGLAVDDVDGTKVLPRRPTSSATPKG